MTRQLAQSDARASASSKIRPEAGFKPVALPAVAAAVRAARKRPQHPKHVALPAILRKGVMTD